MVIQFYGLDDATRDYQCRVQKICRSFHGANHEFVHLSAYQLNMLIMFGYWSPSEFPLPASLVSFCVICTSQTSQIPYFHRPLFPCTRKLQKDYLA